MRVRTILRGAAAALLLLLSGPAGAAEPTVLPDDQPYANKALPKNVVKALSAAKRVYGHLKPPDEYLVDRQDHLYFRGDTAGLNAMLEALAGLSKDYHSQLRATIIPDPGRGAPRDEDPGQTHGDLAFNWSVMIEEIPLRELVDMPRPIDDAGTEASLRVKPAGRCWRVTFDIHLGGAVQLEDLRLPTEYEAVAWGKAVHYVQYHNRRRDDAFLGGFGPTADDPNSFQADTERKYTEFRAAASGAAALGQLVALDQIQAGGIYEGGVTSPYWLLREVFLAEGREPLFLAMLRSDNVVVRAMGMDCLLATQGDKAVSAIKLRLSGRAVAMWQSGCIGDTTTEGAHARRLLIHAEVPRKEEDRRGVGRGGGGGIFDTDGGIFGPETAPPLTGRRQAALEMEILSRNDTAAMHDDAARHLVELLDANDHLLPEDITAPTSLTLPALRALAPGIGDAAIVKALGRIKYSRDGNDVETFLIHCVGDAKLGAQARLAAGSALTRYADANAAAALEANRAALDKLEAGAGTKIWKTFEIRRRHEQAAAADRICEHPMMWEACSDMAALAGSVRTAEMAREVEPWNTYGRVAYLIEFRVNEQALWERDRGERDGEPGRGVSQADRQQSDRQRKRLMANVRAAIDAEQRVNAPRAPELSRPILPRRAELKEMRGTGWWHPTFTARPDLPGAMEQLIELDVAQSDGIGAGWSPSRFYKIKKVFLAQADDAQLRKMLESDNPVVRVMALDCLLQRHDVEAFRFLKPRLFSRAILRTQIGCISYISTEGAFVKYLMTEDIEVPSKDPRYATMMVPRISCQQKDALALEILARDDTAVMHENLYGRVITWRYDPPFEEDEKSETIFNTVPRKSWVEAGIPLEMPELRELTPDLSDSERIKAVGRIKAVETAREFAPQQAELPDVRAFLIRCVGDEKLGATARLAAGSALTRWADANAAAALETNKDALNKLQAGAGTKIWRTFQLRRQYEKDMAVVRQADRERHGIFEADSDTSDANDVTRAVVAAARKYDHPMMWADFYRFLSCSSEFDEQDERRRTADRAEAAAAALVRISARLAEEAEPWNTYGDVVYLAEHDLDWDEHWLAKCKKSPELDSSWVSRLKRLLSAQQYEQVRQNVRAAIAAEEKASKEKRRAAEGQR